MLKSIIPYPLEGLKLFLKEVIATLDGKLKVLKLKCVKENEFEIERLKVVPSVLDPISLKKSTYVYITCWNKGSYTS